MNPHDRVRLLHIVDALSAATKFAEGRKRSDLDTDQMLLFASFARSRSSARQQAK